MEYILARQQYLRGGNTTSDGFKYGDRNMCEMPMDKDCKGTSKFNLEPI